MELIPLKRSAEYDDVESELKALFLSLYKQNVDGTVMEVNTYGMPHLGPDKFISRALNNDGLALMSNTATDSTRLLFMGWRYLNSQRGTPFLRLYLRALFGDVFTIDQLWCKKDGVYPVDVMSKAEIDQAGHDLEEYFLTSRLRVDIATTIVPERILAAARTAVAARFVLELRLAINVKMAWPIGMICHGVQVVRATGKSLYKQREVKSSITVGPASRIGAATFNFSSIPRQDMQDYGKPIAPPARSLTYNGQPVTYNGASVTYTKPAP